MPGLVRDSRRGRVTRWLSLAAVLSVLTGCSSFSLLYSFADSYIIDKADTYLAPEGEDAAFVEQKIDQLMKWHTVEMLPRYARSFNDWANRLDAGPLDRATTTTVVKDMRAYIDDVIIAGAPLAAEILTRHATPEDLAGLRERMAEQMLEKREEMAVPADERAEDRSETIADNVEWMTGTLNDDQRAMIAAYVRATPGSGARWLENRAGRQQAFLSFLEKRPGRAEINAFLVQVLLSPHEIVDPEYREVAEKRWDAAAQLSFDILSSLTETQRRDTIKNLREYAADMLQVSRES